MFRATDVRPNAQRNQKTNDSSRNKIQKTTIDKKLLKTLVCFERPTYDQMAEGTKQHIILLAIRFDKTTSDEKLLKTLVCFERPTYDQMPEGTKQHMIFLATRFDFVFFEDGINIPEEYLVAQRTPCSKQMQLNCSRGTGCKRYTVEV